MESHTNQNNNNQDGKFHSLAKSLLTANLATFGLAVASDVFIGRTPVGFSQVAMEGVDAALPVPLSLAENSDQAGRIKRGIKWRNAANIVHLGAASVGFAESVRFIDNPASFDARSIAISGLIGLWNLGIINKIRQHKKEKAGREPVELTMQSVSEPATPRDLFDESRHTHKIEGRNLNNLETFAKSNVFEAAPAFIGPVAQSLWENGSATSVLVANGIIMGMMANQISKDFVISRQIKQAEQAI